MSKLSKSKRTILIVTLVLVVTTIAVVAMVVPKVQQKTTMESMKNSMKNRQSTISLTKMDLVNSISATGTIASAKTKSVSASVNNMEVEKVYISIGDTVKKGDKLVAFDTTDLEENLSDAKGNLSDVKEEQNENVSDAEDAVTKAKNEYKTAQKDEKVKEETLEQKQEAYENSKKQLENAKKNRTKAIEEAQDKVDEAQGMLDNCAVTAPMAGLVTALNVEKGDTYTGGAIAQIDDISSYTITTSIDEYDISKVKVGQKVVVLTETTGEDELEGEVTFVSPTKGSSNMTGMNSGSDGYTVEIALNTTDERLRLDLTAKCSIVLEEVTDVYAVAYDAIHTSRDGKSVLYAANEDSADGEYTEVEVTTGMETDYYIEISGDDLYEGMKIVMQTDPADTSTEDEKEMEGFSFPGMMGGGQTPNGGMPSGNRGGNRGGQMPSMPRN